MTTLPGHPEKREFRIYPDMVGRMRRVGDAMIADNAVVVGDVRLGKDVNVWFGVTIRGDDAHIEIGEGSNIQDNTCVHVDIEAPLHMGKGVTVGHGVVLHGIEVGDYALIGMNCTILGGAKIGEYAIIGAGALIGEGVVIPPRSVVLGVPGKVRRQVTDSEAESMRWRADHYVQRARTYL